MQYKVVAFDMDGTLLNSKRIVPQKTQQVLDLIRQKGIQVVLVTGRHHTAVYPYIWQLNIDTPAICCNGTYLYDFAQQKSLVENPLTKERALLLLDKVREHKIHTLIYNESAMNYEEMDDHMRGFLQWAETVPEKVRPDVVQVEDFVELIKTTKTVFKFATSAEDIEALRAFAQDVEQSLQLSCEWSWHNRVDVAEAGNSKGNRLKEWVESQGLTMQDVVAFGDNYNDSSMLQMAGLGIAMGNSDDAVKAFADRVIGDNDSEAIAQTLTELFLND